MTVTLYLNTSDPRVVDKSLTVIVQNITITPTSTINVINPVITINFNANYLFANYAYISDFQRYYFVNPANIEIGKRITLPLQVDVLMSYASQIRQCTACVIRSESASRPTYIPDDKLPINPNVRSYQILKFDAVEPYPFSSNNTFPYVLEVI